MTRYVRASTIKTLTSLVTSPIYLLNPLESLNLLPFFSLEESICLNIDPGTFFEEYDEIFRRELIQLITAVYEQLLKRSEKGSLADVEKKGMELLEALVILMLKKEQDWEVKLLTVNFWRISFLSSTSSSSTIKSHWMEELPILYPKDFLRWLKQLEEEEEEKCQEERDAEYGEEAVTRLMGVLEDILHSTAGASMNDLIDCY